MKTNHNQNKQKLSRKKRLRDQIERKKKQKRGGKQGMERAGSDGVSDSQSLSPSLTDYTSLQSSDLCD
jgi:hypothetical protein